MLQLRPGTAKEINTNKYILKKNVLLKHLKRVRHAGELVDLTLPGEERRGHKQTLCVRQLLRGAEEGLGEWTGREGGRAEARSLGEPQVFTE